MQRLDSLKTARFVLSPACGDGSGRREIGRNARTLLKSQHVSYLKHVLVLDGQRCRILGVLPSPFWGGVGGGGRAMFLRWRHHHVTAPPPLPSPPPQGGREQPELAARFGFYLRGRTHTARQYPSARSTTCSSGRPASKRSIWRSTLTASARGSEAAALCGVMVTLGWRQSGLAGASGSPAKTSSV